MRQQKFPMGVLLTPEEGLAADCQTALRSFGLKKLQVVKEFAELQKQIMEHAFDIVLVDTDCLEGADKNGIVSRLRSVNNHKQGVFVALSRINSREEYLEIRAQGFSTVLIKPISLAMMEQALLEVAERQRTQPVDRESLVKVHAHFLQGHTFEAERTLNIWLEKEPESLEGLTLLALHQFKKQEYYRANQTIKKVLKISSEYVPALQMRTRISLRLGQLAEAFQALSLEQRVIAQLAARQAGSPNHMLSKSQIAELSFCEQFQTREGITALLINLGLQLSKTGRSDETLKLYERALGPLEDENSKFIVLFNRGRLYLNLKKTMLARDDLTEAKKIAPEELQAKISELLAMCNLAQEASALDILSKPKQRTGAMAVADLLSMGDVARPKQQKYKPFNRDEVLKLVFLGKMQEDTVPPESVEEWLQMKKRILHILFLDELPLVDKSLAQLESAPDQGAQ
ncbi:MAG: hypothetical protein RL189_1610 [Pseudomonadota bacterium]